MEARALELAPPMLSKEAGDDEIGERRDNPSAVCIRHRCIAHSDLPTCHALDAGAELGYHGPG